MNQSRPNHDRLNRWLTIVAELGVLAGILLVAFELAQNREMMEAQTRNEIAVQIVDLLSDVAINLELADLLRRANAEEALTQTDSLQLRNRTMAMFRYFENAHYQYRQGLYDEAEFAAQREAWRGFMAFPPYKPRWCATRGTFSPDFRSEFDALLATPC